MSKNFLVKDIPYKRILGRCVLGDALNVFWAASGLEFTVKSKEVWVLVEADYDAFEIWLSVRLNGAEISRFMLERGEHWICLAQSLNPEKENTITIQKETQPMGSDPKHGLAIKEVRLSDGGEFCALQPRKLNIEFIGDSITSGEGLVGLPSEMDWITPWMAGTKTYAAQTARTLNADYRVISQCGWGICWGWNGDVNAALPPHYENVCSVLKGAWQKEIGAAMKYDFSEWKADFVVVNLGTNDNGAFFQPPWKDAGGEEHPLRVDENERALDEDGQLVSGGVSAFLRAIRKNNPSAKIIWTWGMIRLVALPDFFKKGIEDYKKETGDKEVYALEFEPMEEAEVLEEDKGSRGHPGPKTHKIASERLTKLIKELM